MRDWSNRIASSASWRRRTARVGLQFIGFTSLYRSRTGAFRDPYRRIRRGVVAAFWENRPMYGSVLDENKGVTFRNRPQHGSIAGLS